MRSPHGCFALALSLAGCLAPGEELTEASLGQTSAPIIGGTLANSADFPGVVAVRFYGSLCTGTLIHPQWVLTAAHCLADVEARRVRVSYDVDDLDEASGRVVEAAEIFAHPQYSDRAWDNDIGLIKLERPITDRAPYPLRRVPIAADSEVLQVGYGDSSDGLGVDGVLRKLATRTLDCGAVGDPDVRGDRLLCLSSSDGDGTCYGDSGGPTFVKVGGKRYVVGVTSGGTEESCKRGYDLHTLVPAELDFITSKIPELAKDDGAGSGPVEPNDERDRKPVEEPESAGCAATGAGATSWWCAVLLGAALVRRRRGQGCRGASGPWAGPGIGPGAGPGIDR